MSSPTDPTAVCNAAREVSAAYGLDAMMEIQRRILKANSEGHQQETDFWQQVSRLMQSEVWQTIPRF